MNIAIFGGSFDPPHIGHQQIVKLALKRLDIDKLFVIPTYLNPFKNEFHLSPKIRLELVKELFQDNISVDVLDYEIVQNRQVSSFETVQYIKSLYDIDKIYLIIGADNLKSLHLWYNFEKLNKLVEFVVISRENYNDTNSNIQTINLDMNIDISSSELRKHIDYNYIPQQIKQKVEQIWKQD